jgi:hypothetical protein
MDERQLGRNGSPFGAPCGAAGPWIGQVVPVLDEFAEIPGGGRGLCTMLAREKADTASAPLLLGRFHGSTREQVRAGAVWQ